MPRNRLLLALAITASTVILVIAVGAWPRATGAPSHPQSIVGTWLVSSSPPATGLTTATKFPSTFISDGTLVSVRPGLNSGAIGVWESTGDRTVTNTTVFFRSDAAGNLLGTTKLRTKVTLNATYDAFTGDGIREDFDTNGKPEAFAGVRFHVAGTRMKVESP